MIADDELANYDKFRDCLSTAVVQRLAPHSSTSSRKRAIKGRKNEIKPVMTAVRAEDDERVDDAHDLAEFIEYLGAEMFTGLPSEVRRLSHATLHDEPRLARRYAVPLDEGAAETCTRAALTPAIVDSLVSYALITGADEVARFMEPILGGYITAATAAPAALTPGVVASRPDGCEVCGREHLPLTYHHLIPRQVHAKAVKRGWHGEWELAKVAWLCRACHSYVHQIATNEELARDYHDVALLLERDDVQKWAAWIGKVRWKAR